MYLVGAGRYLGHRRVMVGNVVDKDGRGFGGTGKRGECGPLQPAIRHDRIVQAMRAQVRLSALGEIRRDVGENDNLGMPGEVGERLGGAGNRVEIEASASVKPVQKARDRWLIQSFARIDTADISGELVALKVEMEAKGGQISLQPGEELQQHLVGIDDDQRPAPRDCRKRCQRAPSLWAAAASSSGR